MNAGGTVEGHGFSRAVKASQLARGFSPGGSRRTDGTLNNFLPRYAFGEGTLSYAGSKIGGAENRASRQLVHHFG